NGVDTHRRILIQWTDRRPARCLVSSGGVAQRGASHPDAMRCGRERTMTLATQVSGVGASWAQVPGVAGPWRLTVDRFLELVRSGFFTEKDRVMLWEGQLVEKMTKNRPHVVVTVRLYDALKPLVVGVGYLEQE